jgi:hypothetical protein
MDRTKKWPTQGTSELRASVPGVSIRGFCMQWSPRIAPPPQEPPALVRTNMCLLRRRHIESGAAATPHCVCPYSAAALWPPPGEAVSSGPPRFGIPVCRARRSNVHASMGRGYTPTRPKPSILQTCCRARRSNVRASMALLPPNEAQNPDPTNRNTAQPQMQGRAPTTAVRLSVQKPRRAQKKGHSGHRAFCETRHS